MCVWGGGGRHSKGMCGRVDAVREWGVGAVREEGSGSRCGKGVWKGGEVRGGSGEREWGQGREGCWGSRCGRE